MGGKIQACVTEARDLKQEKRSRTIESPGEESGVKLPGSGPSRRNVRDDRRARTALLSASGGFSGKCKYFADLGIIFSDGNVSSRVAMRNSASQMILEWCTLRHCHRRSQPEPG
jgi:hypothetical protein